MTHPRLVDYQYMTVEHAAKVLRVNRKTLYAALAADDFPHVKVGCYYRIPVQALLLTPRQKPSTARWEQMELILDPPPIPIKKYRNGDSRASGDYWASFNTRPKKYF